MKFNIGSSRKKKISNFKDILPEILNEFNVEKDLSLENLKSIWNTIVSQTLAEHSIPEKIFKNILIVAVDHSIFANEISLMKNTIIEKIKINIQSLQIEDIRCEVKKLKWNK